MKNTILIVFAILALGQKAYCWGKTGHFIVGSNAALLLGELDKKNEFLKRHNFDLGYYSNVPDVVWKAPETYSAESPQHFLDSEIFEKETGKKLNEMAKDFGTDRIAFEKKYPLVPLSAGRAPWRVFELNQSLEKSTARLRDTKLSQKEKQSEQENWLLTAGVMGHYIGDLSQPLHCTEVYDGQKTNQKGIHSFFEERVVEELYPQIATLALERAKKLWKEKSSKLKASAFEVTFIECEESKAFIEKVQEIDKKIGRNDIEKAKKEYVNLVADRLAAGSFYLAYVWNKSLDWDYDGEKFYYFGAKPEFIKPLK